MVRSYNLDPPVTEADRVMFWRISAYIDRMRRAVSILGRLTESEFLAHFEALQKLYWLETKASASERSEHSEWCREALDRLEKVIAQRQDPHHIDHILRQMSGCTPSYVVQAVFKHLVEQADSKRHAIGA